MSADKETKKGDRPLKLGPFPRELKVAESISDDQLEEATAKIRTNHQQYVLSHMASLKLNDEKRKGKKLILENLTCFLAGWGGQEYFYNEVLRVAPETG